MRKRTVVSLVITVVAALVAGALGVVGGVYYERSRTVTPEGQLKAERLLPLLRHKSPDVRRAAVEALRVLGEDDPVCAASLREVALREPDHTVRYPAFEAVATSKAYSPNDFLLEALKSGEGSVRQQAARHLGKLKEKRALGPLVKLFEDQVRKGGRASRAEVTTLVEAMVDINPRLALPHVLRTLQANPGDYRMQRLVARAATREEAPALAEFGSKLPPNNSGAHLAVINAFRKLRDRSAIPYLTKQLENPSSRVSQEAARALSYTAGRECFDALAGAVRKAVAETDKLPASRSPVGINVWMDVMRNTGDQRACAVFLEVAESAKHRQVRVLAARGLRVCVDPKLGERVHKLWKTADDEHLKRMLKLVLSQATGYGYQWDEKAKDFKKRKPAAAPKTTGVPVPGPDSSPPPPKKKPPKKSEKF